VNHYLLKTVLLAGHRWLTPVILATQEAEIRGIMVQSDPISKKPITKNGWWSSSSGPEFKPQHGKKIKTVLLKCN
jgi:hypothetical protein